MANSRPSDNSAIITRRYDDYTPRVCVRRLSPSWRCTSTDAHDFVVGRSTYRTYLIRDDPSMTRVAARLVAIFRSSSCVISLAMHYLCWDVAVAPRLDPQD